MQGANRADHWSQYLDWAKSPIVALGVLLFCFVSSLIAGSFFLQPQGSKAIAGLGIVSSSSITLTNTKDTLEMNVTPTPDGKLASEYHTLSATTNVPTGYNLSISADNSGVVSGLSPIAGTISSPTTLSNNTWGFAIASSSAVGVINDFNASYATPAPSSASKWASPTAATTIKKTSNAAVDDATDIYFGTKIDTTIPSGTYSKSVTYSATANISDIPAPGIISIAPNTGSTAGGTGITIVGTGFAVNDESVTTAVTVGGSACTDVSISSNTPVTGQDTMACKTSAHAAGAADIAITTWGGAATLTNGYTYVAPANVTFVSPSLASTVAGSESGPAFTIVGSNFTGATRVTIGGMACASFEVVSDTHVFCKTPKSAHAAGSRVVEVAKTFGVSITNGTSSASVTYNSTAYPTLQASDVFAQCATTAKLFRDTRDSQLYYVKKMPDGKCWMVDNLKYANFGDLSQKAGESLTFDNSEYVDPGASTYCTGNTDIPVNTNTRCGLLYNWYAATAGTGTSAESTQGDNVTGNICPINFRLPSATSDGNTATSNGVSPAAADFWVLNTSMSGHTDWHPNGAWSGMFSGMWVNDFVNMGSNGRYWSSTARDNRYAYELSTYETGVDPAYGMNKYYGHAVRCVMEDPTPMPPAGSNPSNISGTNPAVLDVYPTTGWTGDVVAISSNALFTDVENVTIGGTECSKWGVVNSSLVTCKLPAKTAGTTNDIAVTNNGTNVTPTSTYNHMEITYFNPSASTVSVGGTTYNFYANGFTSANCSALSANNSAITSTPAASMAYFRDTRNNQTYKVKKMVDNKCWMVDDLKYINPNMTFNNGDHLNNGGITAYNTVDESGTQSTANSDKRFYNNPMSNSYCYGNAKMPTNSLTRCGYQYNWYAATNGTGTYAQSTQGTNVAGSICPANFRLPSGMSNGSTATSNGTSYNAADFAVLNASMNAGTLKTPGVVIPIYHENWPPSGAWGGTFSGVWDNALYLVGDVGNFWSSTVNSAAYAHGLLVFRDIVDPGSGGNDKLVGFAVRCVLP